MQTLGRLHVQMIWHPFAHVIKCSSGNLGRLPNHLSYEILIVLLRVPRDSSERLRTTSLMNTPKSPDGSLGRLQTTSPVKSILDILSSQGHI